MRNSAISFSEFKGKLINSKRQDFLVFFAEEIEKRKKSDFALTSIKTYQSEYNKLKDYNSHIAFADLTPAFLKACQSYLTHQLGNKQNTVFRAMKTIKSILNEARAQKITEVYPFDEFKFTYQKGTRDRLNQSELERLDALYYSKELTDSLQNILHYFLFACYTGLSFSDLENLDYGAFYKNGEEIFIRSKRKKTDSDFIVPLLDKAKSLIDTKMESGPVFQKMLTNQKSNKGLKNIAEFAQLKKHLTFHVARHTFGTVALNHGIPREVVQKMMGHATGDMTANYAKVLDNYVLKEMKKWDEGTKSKNRKDFIHSLSDAENAYFKQLRIKIISARLASDVLR